MQQERSAFERRQTFEREQKRERYVFGEFGGLFG